MYSDCQEEMTAFLVKQKDTGSVFEAIAKRSHDQMELNQDTSSVFTFGGLF